MSHFQPFENVDSFTSKQIVNEFIDLFPEYGKQSIDTNSTNHFASTFRMNEFYGAFLVVIGIIFTIGRIF